jgi:hypothetical protein
MLPGNENVDDRNQYAADHCMPPAARAQSLEYYAADRSLLAMAHWE